MLDKYNSIKDTLKNALIEGLNLIKLLQYVPKDGKMAFTLLQSIKLHKENVLYLHKEYVLLADKSIQILTSIDNNEAQTQIKSIKADMDKLNENKNKLIGLIDIELKKTAHNV